MKILIADDEALARDGLSLRLREAGYGDIVATCRNGPEAIAAIREKHPDLVFLDIEMPGCNGFEVIDAIGPERMPPVVFLTAYDQFALEAFRVSALDYLLKPVTDQRLTESLVRARQALERRNPAARADGLNRLLDRVRDDRGPDRLMIRAGGRVYFLKLRDVRWIEAEGDYVNVHAVDRTHLIRDTLKRMSNRLATHGFTRIHRSSLVNTEWIRELIANESGDYRVVLRDGTELRLSRTYRDELYRQLRIEP